MAFIYAKKFEQEFNKWQAKHKPYYYKSWNDLIKYIKNDNLIDDYFDNEKDLMDILYVGNDVNPAWRGTNYCQYVIDGVIYTRRLYAIYFMDDEYCKTLDACHLEDFMCFLEGVMKSKGLIIYRGVFVKDITHLEELISNNKIN